MNRFNYNSCGKYTSTYYICADIWAQILLGVIRWLNEFIKKIKVFNTEKVDGVWEQRLRPMRITAVWIYEKCGWIGRVILTSNPREGVLAVRKSFCSCLMLSNPCGVLLAKEMVP